mmetsp:Transcript_6105/g.8914  ORF Transcript_6105/g.8914 Transcript_6105/m.8914 type:complete len:208 (+) Transcript_6105:98-721(+)
MYNSNNNNNNNNRSGRSPLAEWDDDYARLAHAASQLRTSGLNPANFPSGSRESQIATVRSGLEGLLTRLRHLERGCPPAEFARRKNLIDHLSRQVVGGMSPGQQAPYAQPSTSVTSMALKQQDDMIDELALGVGRLKHQTHLINDEARAHVNLLDDMDADVEKAQASLMDETKRAQKLKEDNSVWRLYMMIAGLTVLLVLLLLAGLS